jgi:hypothetical protein
MPMTHKKHLHGGMRLGDVSGLPDKPTYVDIIKALISNVNSCRVISDTSRHSFVVELTMRNFNLINTNGVKVNQFCVKLLLVNHEGVGKFMYNKHKKSVMSMSEANDEPTCQKRIFTELHSIVPDIIADLIMDKEEFIKIFGRLFPAAEAAEAAEAKAAEAAEAVHVEPLLPVGILNFIKDEISITHVNVIIMELFNESMSFVPISKLCTNPDVFKKANIRMAAQLATILLIVHIGLYDAHTNNGLSTLTGDRGVIIDLGKCDNWSLFVQSDEYLEDWFWNFKAGQTLNELIKDFSVFFGLKPPEYPKDPDEFIDFSSVTHAFHQKIDDIRDFDVRNPEFTIKNVHLTLMMLALMDFFNWNLRHLQCLHVIQSVYPNKTFSTFREFLKIFTINPPELPELHHLDMVVGFMNEIVETSRRSKCSLAAAADAGGSRHKKRIRRKTPFCRKKTIRRKKKALKSRTNRLCYRKYRNNY